jgi:imidazolonepropionase-like amidohydrolase/ABC-type multidrug transport system permease subunit
MLTVRATLGLTRAYLLETARARVALFWNLAFPVLFIIGLSYIFGGGEAARVQQIVPGIMTLNLIAAAFFGITLHMVSLRESGLYRRYSATPISKSTIVMAHALTAAVNILISLCIQLGIAMLIFRIRVAGSIGELLLAFLIVAFAFIPLGMLVGSTAGDMRTAPAISNLLFFPLAFLSGAAMPLFLMPGWLKRVAEFLPATYAVELLQAAITRGEPLVNTPVPVIVLLVTGFVGFACNGMLFRWESSERINRRGLAVTLGLLAVIYGATFLYGPLLKAAQPPVEHSSAAPINARILTGLTILDGSGGTIINGWIKIEGDRIVAVGHDAPEAPRQGVERVDLSGLYLIPGLIDSHVHLGAAGGGSASVAEFLPMRSVHDLQVYLALGVTAFVSLTDVLKDMLTLREAVAGGEMRAPRPFFSGPSLTAPNGHPAAVFRMVPGLSEALTRELATEQEAARAVTVLADEHVDIIKLILERGTVDRPLAVLSEPALRVAIATARKRGLRTTVHIDSDESARRAIEASADGLEHAPPDLSDATLKTMADKGITLTPTLAVYDGMVRSIKGEPVTDPLVLQWIEPVVIESINSPGSWIAKLRRSEIAVRYYSYLSARAIDTCRRAHRAGVTLIAGSDAGNAGVFHGWGLIRELELLVEQCGLTPTEAIVAATGHAGTRLGRQEIGRIAPGALADFVILGSDPSSSIRALRDVRAVYLGGRAVDRARLLITEAGTWQPGGFK